MYVHIICLHSTFHIYQAVHNAVTDCLIKAVNDNVSTIAFSALGCGFLEYPADVIAEIMFNSVINFDAKRHPFTSLEVEFVIYEPGKATALQVGLDSLVYFFLFSRTQKVNDPCGQHIYIQEQCSTFDIDKDK